MTCIHVSSGEQLESVHLQRQRAQAAYDLIDYYMQFSRDDTSRIDSLKKEGKEGRRQVAVLLRRLATLAKEIDLPTAEKVGHASAEYGPLLSISIDKRKYRQVL
jgi:exocyst complex component 5